MSAITAKYLRDINDTLKQMVEPSPSGGGGGLETIFDVSISGTPATWTKSTDSLNNDFALSEWELFVRIPSSAGWDFMTISSPGMSYNSTVAESDTTNAVIVENYGDRSAPLTPDPGATVRISGDSTGRFAKSEYIFSSLLEMGDAYDDPGADIVYGMPNTAMQAVTLDASNGYTGDSGTIPTGTRVILRGVRTDTPPITYFTISSTLNHVTSSNATATVVAGGAYSATLSVESGHQLESVSVLMGATDITSSSYSATTGTITIPSVTGNVVIAASAVALKQLTLANMSDFFTAQYSHWEDTPVNMSFSDYCSQSGTFSLTEDTDNATTTSVSAEGDVWADTEGDFDCSLFFSIPCDVSINISVASGTADLSIGNRAWTAETSASCDESVSSGDSIDISIIGLEEGDGAYITVSLTDYSNPTPGVSSDFTVTDATGGGLKLVPGNLEEDSTWSQVKLTAVADLDSVEVSSLYKTEKNADKITVTVDGTEEAAVSGDSAAEASLWAGSLAKNGTVVLKYSKDGSVSARDESQTYIRVRATQ